MPQRAIGVLDAIRHRAVTAPAQDLLHPRRAAAAPAAAKLAGVSVMSVSQRSKATALSISAGLVGAS